MPEVNNWILERNKKLLEWFSGDVDAVEFLLLISDITEVWDDLIDGDKPLTPDQIHTAFLKALFELPTNPFFRKHQSYLMPVMLQAANSWILANTFEKGDNNQRALAYTLRNMDIQVAEAIVYLTGGWRKLREVSAEIWTFFGADQDDILTWLAGGEL